MKRSVSFVIAALCLITLISGAAHAAAPGPSSLTVTMTYNDRPLGGLDIAVCLAAGMREESGAVTFSASPPFSGAGSDFTNLTKERNLALAAALHAYAAANGVLRTQKTTDAQGRAEFPGLPAGLYLVSQVENGSSEYIIAPYLVMVPAINEQRQWNNNVISYPKTEPVRRGPRSMSVHKVWAGVDSPPSGGILVQLYRNGAPYGSCVTLNAGNHWSYTWENLSPDHTWTVDEFDVPAGYVKTITGNTGGFVITNTRHANPPEKTVIRGSKTWNHGSNPADKWPKNILLRLYADGVFILQKEVGEPEHWSWSIRMDRYDQNGREIVYTIDEAPVSDYIKAVDGYDLFNLYRYGPDKPTPPRTDDLNHLVLWLTLTGLSFAGLAAIALTLCLRRYRRREKNLT